MANLMTSLSSRIVDRQEAGSVWTMHLLMDALGEFNVVESISDGTVRLPWKHVLKPWQKQAWGHAIADHRVEAATRAAAWLGIGSAHLGC